MSLIEELSEDLTNLEFNGFFQIHPEVVEAFRQHTESIKEDNSEIYEERLERDKEKHQAYDFSVKILKYNPETGFFLAEGNDVFGESGLVGKISDEMIRFNTVYIDTKKHFEDLKDQILQYRQINYIGNISLENGIIKFNGNYQPVGLSENSRGIWSLEAKINL